MGILNRVAKNEIRDLLGKGWLTHDGMWFYHTYRELGIEEANALNRKAIQSLAPIEIHRAKKILGIENDIDTIEELINFIVNWGHTLNRDKITSNLSRFKV